MSAPRFYSFPGASNEGAVAQPSRTTPVLCPGEGPRPPLDSHRVPLDSREEMVGGVRIETMASDPPHGDSHFGLSALLGPLLQPGYVGSVDMLTRYGEGDDFAADLSVRRAGLDPQTEQRYLEEMVFEFGNSQRLTELRVKAAKMSRRGVRRIFAVLILEQQAYEWDSRSATMRLLEADALRDPLFVCPLPLALLRLIARGAAGRVPAAQVQSAINDFTAEALAVQGNPVLQREVERGATRALAEAVLLTLNARGVVIDDLRRRRVLACTDQDTLRRWLAAAATTTTLEQVLP